MKRLSIEALRELAPGFVMQTLTDEERRQFEMALADADTAAALRPELEAHRSAIELLASEVAVTPPPGLRARLAERIAVERTAAGEPSGAIRPAAASVDLTVVDGRAAPVSGAASLAREKTARVAWVAAGTFGLAAAATLFVAVTLRGRVRELQQLVATQQAIIDRTTARLASRDSTVDAITLGDADLVRVRLATSAPVGPSMQVFWNQRTGRAVVHAAGFAPLPTDRAYCLWVIRNGKPEAVALFNPDADGRRVLNAVAVPQDAASIAAFAVTEEPASGSPQPTMTPFLVGAVTPAAGRE